ncbi:MAG TPA: porphobilinogen synthase [Acidimicrobiales bacterium]|jgi:porphobilinogen synthase|nr:porphobilinogen synthase [Acidimicrobiales bacterium]
MEFPARRLRRLRRTSVIRDLVAETSLDVNDLVAPLFVAEGIEAPRPIPSLPGHGQHTLDSLRLEVRRLVALGVRSVLVFGLPAAKDPQGSSAWDPDGIVQRALRDLRDEHGDELCVMADLCLDEYTDHGHCGVLLDDGSVDNDATLERYARIAVVQADAGADVIAPSGMMDGQVAAIRAALEQSGHTDTIVLAYSAKYATALYGPFRDAVNVSIAHGDRRAYQQDLRNRTEAVTEVLLDIAEGADIVMVKPALSCLDVIADVAAVADVPVAAYHVSGEYAMVKAAAERGWLDGTAVGLEHLTAIRRAGADFVVTYFAAEAAEALGG